VLLTDPSGRVDVDLARVRPGQAPPVIPSPWVGLALALAAYRLTRLGGWDDFPPIAKTRAWILGERWVAEDTPADIESLDLSDRALALIGEGMTQIAPSLPGKQPSSEVGYVRPAYDRPTLAHLFHCPFCLGWWVSLLTYGAWLLDPTWTLYAAAPFALSGVVGLIARNLDP
jgi:hypothetical protein